MNNKNYIIYMTEEEKQSLVLLVGRSGGDRELSLNKFIGPIYDTLEQDEITRNSDGYVEYLHEKCEGSISLLCITNY